MAEKTCYLVSYREPQESRIVSLKAKTIADSSLGLSFIAISDFIFETSSILVDPEAEAQKLKFEDIKTLHLSIYSIISIAEVGEHPKQLNFKHDKANLLVLNQESDPSS